MKLKSIKSEIRQSKGMVLITVCAFILVALILSAVLMRKIASLSTMFDYEVSLNSSNNNDPRNIALARALSALQTGTPTSSPAMYGVTIFQNPGPTPYPYQVTYGSLGDMKWGVTISKTSDSLTPLPIIFPTPSS